MTFAPTARGVNADRPGPSVRGRSARVACGAAEGHCCWISGEVCPFLRDDGPVSRRWVCTLRERLGSWPAVHADAGYQARVAPTLRALGQADCGDWPGPGVTCGECGVSG